MHPLLKRQLKRLGLDDVSAPHSPEIWQQLLERVSRSYLESDQGRELLERSIALSATEMQALNEQLRRTSESRLTEERDKLQTVLRSMGDGLCVVDANWDIVLLNPEAARLCGLSEHEVVGRRLHDTISVSSRTHSGETLFAELLQSASTQGQSFRTDDGVLTATTGRSFPVACVLAPIVRDNHPVGAVLVFRDITERKHIEDRRRETEHLLRQQQTALFELTSNSVIQSGVLEPALREITRVAAATLKVRRCSVWLLQEASAALHCKDLYDADNQLHSSGMELLARDFPSYFGEVLSERVIDATDARTDPRTSEFTDAYLTPLGIGAMLDIPIRFKGKLVGVLCNEHVGPPRAWMLEEQQFGHAIGSQVSLALEAVERLHAEGALRKSEGRTRLIIDTALSAVISMDEQGRIIGWNAQAEQTFGWTRREAIGRMMTETIIPYAHREAHQQGLERFIKTGEGQVMNKRIETTALRRDGTEFPIELAVTPLRLENAYSFTAFVVDISERKQAEEALRTSEARLMMTVQGSHIGIWDWNLTTGSIYFSPQWKSQLGHDDHTLTNAFEEWRMRIHPEDQPFVHKTIQSCLDGDQSHFEIEHRLHHQDGNYRWILSRGSVIRDVYGVASRMVGIHIDTTERKRSEEELRAAKESAEAASKAKSEFLANMSHEIRTPMNGVLGTTELLLNSALTDKQRHLASTVHRSGRTLLAIINDILDFSKIEAGKLDLECVGFDLLQVLEESLELFMEAGRRKKLELTQQIDERVPRYLKGDPVRFRQILMNLLSNAIKFTETGGITLVAEFLSGTTTHALLRFAVSDTGIGIPAAAKLRIFDAFSQADGSTTRRFGGTGLGLSIAKQLVALMGGAITVESEPGRGSTFAFSAQFELQPLSTGSDTTVACYSPPPHSYLVPDHAGGSTHPLGSPSQADAQPDGQAAGCILLAEDSPVNREVAVGMLEQLGYQVEIAENGRQALLATEHAHFDLILMDCQMPEMDGLTATSEIRQRETEAGRSRLPIIALTANAMQGDRELCLSAGMDDYLTKPYTQMQLREIIQKWLSKRNPLVPASVTNNQAATDPGVATHVAQATSESATTGTGHTIDLKALDAIRALQRPNRPAVLASVLRKYLDNSRDSVDALRDALRANDPAGLQAVAHRLKSSSAQLGAIALAARCKELELMGATKNLVDADRTLAALQSEYANACTVFRNEIAKEKQA
ncbi:MAG: PAS domain S-box protein [Nitrospira sp.]|nr:PAS domain S-box protein [Nitrospira sp.]MCC7473323.1 PAS domain S-box protein [Candidatus Nomurabacteria bacterium]